MPRTPASASNPIVGASPLNQGQIDKLAEMVADNRCPLPDDLLPGDERRLKVQVQRQLRDRLTLLIARAVVGHLRRESERCPED